MSKTEVSRKEIEQAAEAAIQELYSSNPYMAAQMKYFFIAGTNYILSRSRPVKTKPYGYVFEDKFYKTIPERTFFEGNTPVEVYREPVKPDREWVSVENCKTAPGVDVLGTHIDDQWVAMIWFDGESWFNHDDVNAESACYPTHVMPLPTPPTQ